jgi:Fe-S oxidoreductase
VDLALLKMEADYHYYRRNGMPFRNKFFGHFHRSAKWGSTLAPISNAVLHLKPLEHLFKRTMGIAADRSIPRFALRKATSRLSKYRSSKPDFILYIDEFTQYQDVEVALAAAKFFTYSGYAIKPVYAPSARAYFSKAMLDQAKSCATSTLRKLSPYVQGGIPIVGLEPSAILGFRDEFTRLFSGADREEAEKLSGLAKTFEEFVADEMDSGRLDQDMFTDEYREVQVHVHCHQKALSHPLFSLKILNFPRNYQAVKIPSGCCGMAGSFGYETEHFEISQQIGERVLFPRVRSLPPETILVAAGTSCRHQLVDGVGRTSFHPAQVLLDALKTKKPR